MLKQELKEETLEMILRLKKVGKNMNFAEMSHREFFTLKMLYESESHEENDKGVRVSELAKEMKISMPLMSRALKSLEEKKYIERYIDSCDRRNTYVKVTEEGKNKQEYVAMLLDDYMSTVVDRYGEEKIRQLIDMMNEMTSIMSDELVKRKEKNNV